MADKLWNRNFTLLVIVQIVALFGNAILSFALPLYILRLSGSPALFGTVLALSFVPLIIMSPIGGIIADRGRKQRIMFWMDAVTALLIVAYSVASGIVLSVVPIVVVKLMALNVMQGIYMPTVMASVPFLVPSDKLVPGNAITNMVLSLSNAVGPVIGGILFSAFGLFPILAVSFVAFVIAGIIDLFIRVPYERRKARESLTRIVKTDLTQCARLAFREKPILGKIAVTLALFNIPSMAMIIVSLPVLITQTLDMSMRLFGISQGIMVAGGVLGGVLIGALEKKLTIGKAHLLLLAGSLFTAPIGLVLLLDPPAFTAYVVITASSAMIMMATQMVAIQVMAFVQGETSTELVGKIMSVVMVLFICAYPVGQLLFGVLLERFAEAPWLVMFAAVFMSGTVAVYSGRHFRGIATAGR